MSFRSDDQRRYGHVPPVQYPVQDQPYSNAPGRRPSFNSGDDRSFYDQGQDQSGQGYTTNASRGEDELFLSSPTDMTAGRTYGNVPAASGYQHQYQADASQTQQHSGYNPQQFARSQSTTLPYHPTRPVARYASNAGSPPQPPTSFTPPAYNPAAYASTTLPQRQATYSGYSSYGQNYSQSGGLVSPTHPAQSPGSTYPATFGSSHSPQPSYDRTSASPSYLSRTSSTTQTPMQNYDTSYSTAPHAGTASNGASSHQPYHLSSAQQQTPYPINSNIPVGPHGSDPTSFNNRVYRSHSQSSSSSAGQQQQQQQQSTTSLQRHPTNAPLPSRPMDNLPEDSAWTRSYTQYDEEEQRRQDNIMRTIEEELLPPQRRTPINGQANDMQRFNSTASTAVSRTPSSTSNAQTSRYPVPPPPAFDDDDDDDPEGTAGVLAMKQAEMEDRRFSGFSGSTFPYTETPTSTHQSGPPIPPKEYSSDSDFGGFPAMDISLASGGYAGNLHYGHDMGSPPANTGGYHASQGSFDAAAFKDADVDYGGEGGLQEPKPHRQSFDDGDESLHSRQSGSESPVREDYQDLFYHPGIGNRPLPAVPAQDLSLQIPGRPPYHSHSMSADSRPAYAPDSIYTPTAQASQQVERSISLTSHSHTPVVQAPARSRTDAADERRKQAKLNQGGLLDGYDTGTPSSLPYDGINLEAGGTRKRALVPSRLTLADIRRCAEPWALSGIADWIRQMADGDVDLKAKTVEEILVRLFTAKVPTMHVADAETLSSRVVGLMLEAEILIPEEEWVKFGRGTITGVLWQLTGYGCYSSRLHDVEVPGRCYSYHCARTLKKVKIDDLLSEEKISKDDWATFYHLTKEMVEGKDKKEIERQNILHEIVTSEESYMNQLEVLRVLYRDQLMTSQPPIISPNKMEPFLAAVFGKVDVVQLINKDYLLAQLKYRQKEQGPWIQGFSDLFREWIRKAKTAYIEYASSFPNATHLVRKEAERNLLFARFLDDVRSNKRSMRLDWTTFLKSPITRLQRYTFLLDTVKKTFPDGAEEKTNLLKAIAEIHKVTLECDAKVAEKQKAVEMRDLESMLVLRPGFHSMLHLDHLGRELILQGDLTRMGSKGVRWVDTHALLFDHYLILAKVVTTKDGRGEKKYDVSKEPIPMRLLFLESSNDEPIPKQKSLTAPLTSRTGASSASETRLNKISSNASSDRPGIEHSATSTSLGSSSRGPGANLPDEGKMLYPFRIKHLGHDVYTLYASTSSSRNDWCMSIRKTKERHARSLWAQNAEPFKLRVLADCSFAYDSMTSVARTAADPVKGTPLDRAIRDLDEVYGQVPRPAPVCRAAVNCATAFSAFGKSIIAVGTDYGVFISSVSDPRGWMRTVNTQKVTQIAVLEEFSVCLIIADRNLISYPLDVVAPISEFPAPANDSPRRAPTKLAKDVSFFAAARMKERMLVFYKRSQGLHNSFFHVLEPVYQRATEKKSRFFGSKRTGGITDTFRDFDEFVFPADCYGLNIFQTYIAVSTSKGFEMLTLDKKQPMSIPDLKEPAIANVASRVRELKPLGMFKLNDQEYILAYEECAVYVDRHGEVSRTLIMEFSGKGKKARGATMYGQYLILFNDDYVEVRNAENGRLRQIIAGRDVRCLDYGTRGPTGGAAPQGWTPNQPHGQMGDASSATVKIAMAHPETPGMQILLELVLNDGHAEGKS